MKVAFDIGGVISRYPEKMKTLMRALQVGGMDVHIITDIPEDKAHELVRINGLDFIPAGNVHSASWTEHQDLCKTKMCEELGIDFIFDDRPDYVAVGNFIGFVLSPRPSTSYYAPEWKSEEQAGIV